MRRAKYQVESDGRFDDANEQENNETPRGGSDRHGNNNCTDNASIDNEFDPSNRPDRPTIVSPDKQSSADEEKELGESWMELVKSEIGNKLFRFNKFPNDPDMEGIKHIFRNSVVKRTAPTAGAADPPELQAKRQRIFDEHTWNAAMSIYSSVIRGKRRSCKGAVQTKVHRKFFHFAPWFCLLQLPLFSPLPLCTSEFSTQQVS